MSPSIKKCYPPKRNNKRNKPQTKKIGIISCIITGLLYLYQLILGDETTNLPGVNALQERVKTQIKMCVKEALIEYELERTDILCLPTTTSSSMSQKKAQQPMK